MEDLDALGQRHTELVAELKEVREKLAPLIRAERAKGTPLLQIAVRSGYGSVENIRLIVDPERREKFNEARRNRNSAKKTARRATGE